MKFAKKDHEIFNSVTEQNMTKESISTIEKIY